MADRRRVNGPDGQTLPPLYDDREGFVRPSRQRKQSSIRAIYLKTGVTPTASGSAYLEMEFGDGSGASGMKLTCTVHGPRSLPRSAPFSPHMVLSTHVKYAPFATRQRRGYLRDTSERDLSSHLETALRGVIIADRWPKSGVDVVVTVIEGDATWGGAVDEGSDGWDMLNVLSGCITVAAAAVVDSGIDCVDIVSGGVAALVPDNKSEGLTAVVLDPVPAEHSAILAACCVAYLPTRDEISNIWLKGQLQSSDGGVARMLIARAIQASKGTSQAITASLAEVTIGDNTVG